MTIHRMPVLFDKDILVMYDVDDTLILRDCDVNTIGAVAFICPYDGTTVYAKPHKEHIKLLKEHRARGRGVVVWSSAGYQWAEAVIDTLGLSEYVDLIMSKPNAFVDDLPADQVLTSRIYIQPRS